MPSLRTHPPEHVIQLIQQAILLCPNVLEKPPASVALVRIIEEGRVVFLSNNAGGILGGISTGQDIVARFAVKPTSSIPQPMRTVDVDGNEVEIETHGRHDPCP